MKKSDILEAVYKITAIIGVVTAVIGTIIGIENTLFTPAVGLLKTTMS